MDIIIIMYCCLSLVYISGVCDRVRDGYRIVMVLVLVTVVVVVVMVMVW